MTATMPAPARNRGGRPSRGDRVETKLPPEDRRGVEYMVGHLGSDRSEVIARLVRHGLAHRDRLADDVATVRAWAAEDWSETCAAVTLDKPGPTRCVVVVWHIDPETGRDDEAATHTEILTGPEAAAAWRLHRAAEDAAELGFGVLLPGREPHLIVRCHPGA